MTLGRHTVGPAARTRKRSARPAKFRPQVTRLEDRTVPSSTLPLGDAPAAVISTGALKYDFLASDVNFHGGVRVAVGGLNGDGTDDIICAAGPGGGPVVRAYDGRTGVVYQSFMAYDSHFTGGVYVAVGDVTGSGHADIITGAGPTGGPHVEVWDGTSFAKLSQFYAYDPRFTGGVRVAAGDVDGD